MPRMGQSQESDAKACQPCVAVSCASRLKFSTNECDLELTFCCNELGELASEDMVVVLRQGR